MDMFLKMYNVKTFPVRDGTQTLLRAHVFYFKAQSVRKRSKWLRQSVAVWTAHVSSQKVIRQIKMCQILCWSSTISEAQWDSDELRTWTVGHVHGLPELDSWRLQVLLCWEVKLRWLHWHEANVIDKSCHVVFSPNRHFQCWYDCVPMAFLFFSFSYSPLRPESLLALEMVGRRLEDKMTVLRWDICVIRAAPHDTISLLLGLFY